MNQPPIRVNAASPDDAPLVRQIMLAAFEQFRGTLEPPSSALDETIADTRRAIEAGGAALAWLGDQAIGSARYEPRPDYLYVSRVSVLPAYRGRGIAAALLAAMDDQARRLSLPEVRVEVRHSLPANLAFFRRLGFQTISEQPHPRGPAYWTSILGKSTTK